MCKVKKFLEVVIKKQEVQNDKTNHYQRSKQFTSQKK